MVFSKPAINLEIVQFTVLHYVHYGFILGNLCLDKLLNEIKQCTLCEAELPLGARPVLQASSNAKVLIVGQAPGTKVHATGIPFDDPSGNRLRDWMGVDRETFYNPDKVAIIPMGFCYPGRGKSGDLPPRPECATTWRAPLLEHLTQVQLTLLVGQYALAYHLPKRAPTLTDTVKNWQMYWPDIMPLPHPSPRNNIWLKRNDWFEEAVLPTLRKRIANILD